MFWHYWANRKRQIILKLYKIKLWYETYTSGNRPHTNGQSQKSQNYI